MNLREGNGKEMGGECKYGGILCVEMGLYNWRDAIRRHISQMWILYELVMVVLYMHCSQASNFHAPFLRMKSGKGRSLSYLVN